MLCVTVNETGQLVQAAQLPNPAECYAVVMSGPEWGAFIAPDFATFGITPGEVTTIAAWGFASVMAGWALGLVAGWLAEAIRKA